MPNFPTDGPVAAASRPLANQVVGAGIVQKVEQVLPDTTPVFLHEIGCGVPQRFWLSFAWKGGKTRVTQ